MKPFIGKNLINSIYCLFFLLCFFYASEAMKSNNDKNRLCGLFNSCKNQHKISYKDNTKELEHFGQYVKKKLKENVKNQQALYIIDQEEKENDVLKTEFEEKKKYSMIWPMISQQNNDVEKTENEVNDSTEVEHFREYGLKIEGLMNTKLKENMTYGSMEEHLEMTCRPGEIYTSARLCVNKENMYKFWGECGRWQEKYDEKKFKHVPQVYDPKNKKYVPQVYGEKKKKVKGGKRMEIQNTCAWNQYCNDDGYCKEVSYGDQLEDIRNSDWLEKKSITWPTVYYYGYRHEPQKRKSKCFFKELFVNIHKIIYNNYFIVAWAPPLKKNNSFRSEVQLEVIHPKDLKFVKPFAQN